MVVCLKLDSFLTLPLPIPLPVLDLLHSNTVLGHLRGPSHRPSHGRPRSHLTFDISPKPGSRIRRSWTSPLRVPPSDSSPQHINNLAHQNVMRTIFACASLRFRASSRPDVPRWRLVVHSISSMEPSLASSKNRIHSLSTSTVCRRQPADCIHDICHSDEGPSLDASLLPWTVHGSRLVNLANPLVHKPPWFIMNPSDFSDDTTNPDHCF